MSAVRTRISSMITCADGRARQSTNSNWMTPMVSSVSSPMPARLLADAGVDGPEAGKTEHALLDLGDRAVLLVKREIAAAMHDHLAIVGLDRGEELDPATELAIGHLHRDEQKRRERQRRAWVPQRQAHRAHVGPAVLDAVIMGNRRCLAEQRAERRREEQRDRERGGQRRDQRDRQIFHELPDHARPEQQRREGGDARRGRRDHRARHALGGRCIGLPRRHALRHAAFRELGDDDGIVDQHANGEDQREQHHDVDGEADHLQAEHAGKERSRDRDADEQRGAEAEHEQDDDDDQQHAGDDRVLQVGQHLPDHLRLVLRESDVNSLRPLLLQLRDDVFHRIDGLDQIGAGALRHLDGHGRTAVDAGDRGRVLEGRLDLGDVEQGHRCCLRGDHRHLGDVLRLLEQRRHLDGEAAALAFERARCDQRIERLGKLAELVEPDPVALHQRRLDDDLDRLVARAAQLGCQHARRLLDRVLGPARDAEQSALRHVAGEPDHQHRVEREIDLEHLRLVDVARQIMLGDVDLGAHVGKRGFGIEARLELEQDKAAAFEGGGAHLLDVADRLELGLDRPQQQPLGVLRADAALGELHVDDRNLDVRLRLLRDRHIGNETRQ